MSKAEKQSRAEARVGQPLAVYFTLPRKNHTPLRAIAKDLGVGIITAKVWSYQYNPDNYRLIFGAIITAPYVLILAGATVGGYLTYYWINPY